MYLHRIVICLTFFISFSCVTNSTSHVVKESYIGKGPFLYKVTKEGLKPSYVFGTIHIGVSSDELPTIVGTKLLESSVYVSEIRNSELSDPSKMVRYTLAQPGSTFKDHVSSHIWQKYLRFVGEGKIPEKYVEGLSDFGAWIIAHSKINPSGASIDTELGEIALKTKKKIIGLESIEQQMGFVEQMELLDSLKYLLTHPDQYQQHMNKMFDLYRRGDLQGIWSLITDQSNPDIAMTPKQKDILLTKRNLRWIQVLPALFKRDSTFVAVGLGHLVGEQGVLQLLESRGFQVQRLGS